jgi:hypothetical protein
MIVERDEWELHQMMMALIRHMKNDMHGVMVLAGDQSEGLGSELRKAYDAILMAESIAHSLESKR